MENDHRRPAHAIVIGGSIVGSAVAALLARRFERVTILERDSLPPEPVSRAGVPQARHVHALLARGADELERIFPGFVGEMALRGAQLIDVGRNVAWLTAAGWGVPFESGITLCCATRTFIEWHARRRTLQLSNITLVDGAAVTGLLTDAGGERVVGVGVRHRGDDPAADGHRQLNADLVVDATGRASQLPDWLLAMGRRAVRETVVDARMTYASRFYAVPAADLRGWRAAYVQAALPQHRRGGILFPVEGNRYHLTLLAYGNPAPPTDEGGFRSFTEGLRHPILADILRYAEPLSPITAHRRTENRWRHFDGIDRWPDGLVALGDSLCCFDPVYGQGMSTGILSALSLARCIDTEWSRRGLPAGFSGRAQRALVDVVRPAWNLATGEDLRLPSTTGGRLRFRDRLLQRYLDTVIAAATADRKVRARLLSVMNMLTGPETLLHPTVIGRVVRYASGGKSGLDLWPTRPAALEPEPRDAGARAFTAGWPTASQTAARERF